MPPTDLSDLSRGATRRLARIRRRYLSFAAPISIALALVLGTTALIAETRTAHTADAAVLDGAITSVSVQEDEVDWWNTMRVDMNWSVPDSAASGDTFTLNLPPELYPLTTGFDLLDSQNRVVAHATVSGGVATFELTSYADTFNSVSGNAYFYAQWNHSVVTVAGPVDLQFVTSTVTYTDTVTVGPDPGLQPQSHDSSYKWSWWNDGADQGHNNPTDAAHYSIGSAGGPIASFTVDDTPSSGVEIDCGTLRIERASAWDDLGYATVYEAVTPTALDCSPGHLGISLGALDAGAYYTINYDASITDQSAGKYTNSAVLTTDGAPNSVANDLWRTGAGGSGGGFTEPHIDIEKYATSLGATDGDADVAPGLELDPTAATPITFAVENDGNEALVDVTVSDTTDEGAAVVDLSCDFSALGGPSSGTTWAGPFAVGASFTCSGSLPALGSSASHADTASVTATSQTTAVPVSDEDEFHATTPEAPPAEVSVGDYVWFDTDGDGLQDAGEPGIEGVTLTISGPDGGPVTDVDGEVVGPVDTDADGAYSFDHLPVLPAGEHYTVHLDGESPALDGYVPTIAGAGDDRAVDSSTDTAESTDLTDDGASDTTLDFGFVTAPV